MTHFIDNVLPYVIAGLGIASTIFLIAWVIRDLIRQRRGSLVSSPAPTLDELLDEMDWSFQCGPRLPK